jgi:hypothetical protein
MHSIQETIQNIEADVLSIKFDLNTFHASSLEELLGCRRD